MQTDTIPSENEPLIDRLIREAYGIAGRPERLVSLLEQVQAGIDVPDTGAGEKTPVDVSKAQMHFEEAGRLIDEVVTIIGSDFSGFDPSPGISSHAQLVLDEHLNVVSLDRGLFTGADLREGEQAPEWLWDPVESKEDRARIANCLENHEPGFLRLYLAPEDETGRWFAIQPQTRAKRTCDDTRRSAHRVLLSSVQFEWRERSGAQFREALKLTDVELALTRHLVSGGTVRSFAESRGRALGTARNQLKALLRKLAIGSQQELLMLYTGFAHSLQLMDNDTHCKRHICTRVFYEEGGSRIAWEQHGDPHGFPVIYFHPFFEGALFTPEQDAAAREAGFRVIAPWRPYMGETTGRHSRQAMVRDFAVRLGPFLHDQGITRCGVLAATAGAPFALGFLQAHGAKATGAVLAAPAIPFAKWSDLREVAPGFRRPLQLTRMAPAFARIYIRATVAGTLRGDFDRFINDFYNESPLDRPYYNNPEIRDLIRRCATYTFISQIDGPTEGMILEATNFSDLCENIDVPVTLAIGETSTFISAKAYTRFAERYGFSLHAGFERSGQLVMHDNPRRIFALLRKSMLESRA